MRNTNIIVNFLAGVCFLLTCSAQAHFEQPHIEPVNPTAANKCTYALTPESSPEFLVSEMAKIRNALENEIVGQREFIESILIALITNKGHLLVEGAPGLAKTRALKVLSKVIEGTFARIQFRGDMSASDITTAYERDSNGTVIEKAGKINHNFILADEINRGSAKAQAGLLEPMEEGQVSLLSGTHKLPSVFLVMATQNPTGDAGTNELSAAQLDRFLMNVLVDYPDFDQERDILDLYKSEELGQKSDSNLIDQKVSLATIEKIRRLRAAVEVPIQIKNLMVQIVRLTRPGNEALIGMTHGKILQGAGPRAAIALQVAAQARAWLNQRNVVDEDDVNAIAANVLRHRITLDRMAKMTGAYSENQLIHDIVKAAKDMQ